MVVAILTISFNFNEVGSSGKSESVRMIDVPPEPFAKSAKVLLASILLEFLIV